MALAPGTRLGVYEVAAQIGEGGMGQVYRARDTKLGRDVALKILPDAVAQDPDRVARFKREAQVLAALNHPHIAAIYGFDEAASAHSAGSGQASSGQAGATQFLVLEFAEGETLADRVKRGPIPVDETIAIARQIGEALEEAHEKGIIHRDLKPANVAFTAKDQVKVLDFGLAKLVAGGAGQAGGAGNLSMSPTLTTPAMTAMGMILGTAAYMAPEQAKGREADKRSDLWAFGCVVFEMLTAKRAFDGEDITDTIAAIMRGEPDWTALPAATPANVRQLLELCLTKDRRQRAADIAVVQFLLSASAREPATSNAERGTPNDERRTTSVWRESLPWAVASALAVAAVALLILWAPWRAQTLVDRPLVRLDVDLGADVSLPAPGNAGSNVAISPDGTRLVYASGNPTKLFTRRLDQSKPTELSGTEGAQGPFVSPDGRWVGFAAGGKLNKISVEGGAVVPLGEAPSFAGASWSDDGSIMLGGGTGSRGLLRIPADGGTPEILVSMADGEAARARPQVLPGGKAVLFTVSTSGSGDISRFNVEVLTLSDRHRKIVARGGSTARYLPTSTAIGHLVYTNYATLFAVPFDLEKLETRGTAIPVLDDVGYFTTLGAGGLDVSRTGTLVYRRAGANVAAAGSTLQWIDTAGRRTPLRATPGFYSNLSLSPDGARVALLSGEAGLPDVWVYDAQREAMTRLTFVRGNYGSPRWSPDSQYVVFVNFSTGGIFSTRADGASQPALLVPGTPTQSAVPWSFTPDGTRLAYFERAGGSYQLWTVPLENQGGQLKSGTPEPFLKSSFSDMTPSFSPDGRWLAYHSDESGKNEVYVRAFPPPSSGPGAPSTSLRAGKWLISNTGGTEPRWSRTGHDLLYRSGDQIMTASYTVKGDAFVAEKPRVWIAKLGAPPASAAWDLAPDGKRVAVVMPVESAEAPRQEHEVVFLQNFFDELRRRAPLPK